MSKALLKSIAKEFKVSDFADYRVYLHGIYAEAKLRDSSYSYAKYSTDLDLGSTNAHAVVKGSRKLTDKSAKKITQILNLTGVQRKYFLSFVHFENSKNATERGQALKERTALKRELLPTELDKRKLSFFEHWYHAVILELLRLPDAKDNTDWIRKQIRPSVSKVEIESSLELLKELKYLEYNKEKGRFFPTETTISSGRETYGIAIANYHRQMLSMSVEALDNCHSKQRDISAVTLTLNEETFASLKEDVLALRKKYLKLAAELEDADSIVQLNAQIFSLSKPEGEKP